MKYFSGSLSQCLLLTTYCLLAASCNRCQTCKVKDAVGNTLYYAGEKCDGIEKYKKDLKDEWVCYNYTVNDSDGITVFVSKQICGNVDSLAPIKDSLYNVFIADSPTVVVTPLFTRVECAVEGE